MSSHKKYYVVWEGRIPGVYDNWDDAFQQIDRFKGARYKAYSSSAEAAEAYRKGLLMGENVSLGAFLKGVSSAGKKQQAHWSSFQEIDRNAWAVDASCMGNPGIMEYQCVDLATGRTVFRIGPYPDATNNIGEYLAIVHAMALMEKQGIRRTIYSDSRIGMSWVRKGKANTTLRPTPKNAFVRRLIMRADHWLGTHTFRVPILKWDTDRWGEIPADFHRK